MKIWNYQEAYDHNIFNEIQVGDIIQLFENDKNFENLVLAKDTKYVYTENNFKFYINFMNKLNIDLISLI